MPKKPADPTRPKAIRRPKADPPAPPVEPIEEEEVAAMNDHLHAIAASIPVDVQAIIVSLLLATPPKNLTACRKLQDAATEGGAPELTRAEQRAVCVALAQAYVAPEGAEAPVADDSGGQDDSYDAKPPAPVPRLTGKRILGKRAVDRECPINSIQFHDFSIALAKCEGEAADMRLAHKAVRARLKEELDDSNANRKRLADIITRGVEVRSCTVIVEADYSLGIVREIDETSGDVMETRPLTAAEMQLPLLPVEMLTEIKEGGDEGGREFAVIDGANGGE